MSDTEAADFEIQIDVSAEREWGGESGPTVDPGVYDLEITAAEQSTSKKNQPVLKIEFTVLNEGPFNGTSFKKSYSLQKQSLGRVKNLLMACGSRLDSIRSSELLNKQIVAEIVHTQGEPQPQADGSMREGGVFMDVINETMPESAAPAPEPVKPEPPKVTAPTNTTKTSAVRRAVGTAKAPTA